MMFKRALCTGPLLILSVSGATDPGPGHAAEALRRAALRNRRPMSGSVDSSRFRSGYDDEIMQYARFCAILKIYRGVTEPFISHGDWRQHPMKVWDGVQAILHATPCHGTDIEKGKYTAAEFNQKRGAFLTTMRQIIHKLQPGNKDWHTSCESADQLYAAGVGLSGQRMTYDFDGYKREEIIRHWVWYYQYAREMTINDKGKDTYDLIRDVENLAYHGVEASFSRGITDRFWIPSGTTNDADSFFGDKSKKKSPAFLVHANGQPTSQALQIVHQLRSDSCPAFHKDMERHGSYTVHGLTRRGQKIEKKHYIYHMLWVRVSLMKTIEKVNAMGPAVGVINANKIQAMNFFQQKLVDLEALANRCVANPGDILGSFFIHGTGAQNAVHAKQFVEAFRTANPMERIRIKKLPNAFDYLKWRDAWWLTELCEVSSDQLNRMIQNKDWLKYDEEFRELMERADMDLPPM